MSELTEMMNIGKEMSKKLMSVGITSAEELAQIGAKQAFLQLKQEYPNVCLVHLYTLEGAICNTEYNCLSEEKKKELKEFSDFLCRQKESSHGSGWNYNWHIQFWKVKNGRLLLQAAVGELEKTIEKMFYQILKMGLYGCQKRRAA